MELLLPLQGAGSASRHTQGAALGYKQDALSGRVIGCSVSQIADASLDVQSRR